MAQSKRHNSGARIQHLLRKQAEMEELLDEECFEEALGYNPDRCTLEVKGDEKNEKETDNR